MIVHIYCVKSVLQKNTVYFIFNNAASCSNLHLKRLKLVAYVQLHIPINQNCKVKQDIYTIKLQEFAVQNC